jgi:hypothetical protein
MDCKETGPIVRKTVPLLFVVVSYTVSRTKPKAVPSEDEWTDTCSG